MIWPGLLDTSFQFIFQIAISLKRSGQHISTLIEVSPDGSVIKKNKTSPVGIPISIGNTTAAIGMKCPFPLGTECLFLIPFLCTMFVSVRQK